MDFLLECIGFSPDWDLETVMGVVRERGEPTPWRGRVREHLTMPLAGGLELRLDQEPDLPPNLWPFYSSRFRRRVGVRQLLRVADSPGDAILVGRANPRAPEFDAELDEDEEHDLTCYLTDAQRLPGRVPADTVMAIVLAGFSLQVEYIGPNEASPARYGFAPEDDFADLHAEALNHPLRAPLQSPKPPPTAAPKPTSSTAPHTPPINPALAQPINPAPPTPLDAAVEGLLRGLSSAPPPGGSYDVLANPRGAALEILGAPASPSASMQISARIRTVSHLTNHLTGKPVNRIELDVPGLPVEVFVSPWQLEADGLPMPKPGWRIEGVFLMLGRNVGAVPKTKRSGVAFG